MLKNQDKAGRLRVKGKKKVTDDKDAELYIYTNKKIYPNTKISVGWDTKWRIRSLLKVPLRNKSKKQVFIEEKTGTCR